MSEELEWELFDIFESGLFPFPIWDHKSAREIVAYLLRRGVLPEEIADAIEDSTFDLEIWLNRGGKTMVGEWVIAWVNECRDDYDREKELERPHYIHGDHEFTPESLDSFTTTDTGDQDNVSQTEVKRVASFLNMGECGRAQSQADTASTATIYDEDPPQRQGRRTPSPPPLPPRSLPGENKNKGEEQCDQIVEEFLRESYKENLYEMATDGGATSLYDSIPHDDKLQLLSLTDHNGNCNNCNATDIKVTELDKNGLPVCPNCTCTLSHYSYMQQVETKDQDSGHYTGSPQYNDTYCDLYLELPADTIKAMEVHFETLDMDCPGFIFIMTDSVKNGLSWSTDNRYKIASSRQPERCLMEFQSRNIEVELIWKIKVHHHLKAVKEVHSGLQGFNIHSDWFHCSLRIIMDTVAQVAKRYKTE